MNSIAEFLTMLVACGAGISVFAIYMHYRSKGIGVLFGGRRRVGKRDIENMQRELKALREHVEGMSVDSQKSQEMMADILLSIEDQRRALHAADPVDVD